MFRFSKTIRQAERYIENLPPLKRRRRRRKFLEFIKYFTIGFVSVVIVFFVGLTVYSYGFWQIGKLVLDGKSNLDYTIASLDNYNFFQAESYASRASSDFYLARLKLNEKRQGYIAQAFPFWSEQLDNFNNLIITAETLSQAAQSGSGFGKNFQTIIQNQDQLSFSQFSTKDKQEILRTLSTSSPVIEQINNDLSEAAITLNKVEPYGLLAPFKEKIIELKNKLETARDLAKEAAPLTEMFPALAGYPERAVYLVMLQNSDELRPTGGFLGTYGILEVENGEIIRFDTHDIYHLDMPVANKINVTPPAPLALHLNKKWYLRDANWSPDWPTAAEQIVWFYQVENNLLPPQDQINNFSGQFDGVIGITPKFISELLKITGPITIEGEQYTADNFSKLLEYRVEKGYVDLGIPSWHRKEVIGDIAKEIKIRLFDLPFSRWPIIIKTASQSLFEKDIILFLADNRLEDMAANLDWTGEIKKTEGDYLMVVDANLGAFKTDAVMNKNITYALNETANGLIASVRINYAHHGGYDWRTTNYQTYTRVLVPAGSRLIKAEEYSGDQIINNFKLDTADFTAANGTIKTSFGAYLVIKPGEMGGLYLEYRLPDVLYKNYIQSGVYNLLVQKQPGNNIEDLSVDLNPKNAIKSYNPVGFSSKLTQSGKISWKNDLLSDKEYEIKFK